MGAAALLDELEVVVGQSHAYGARRLRCLLHVDGFLDPGHGAAPRRARARPGPTGGGLAASGRSVLRMAARSPPAPSRVASDAAFSSGVSQRVSHDELLAATDAPAHVLRPVSMNALASRTCRALSARDELSTGALMTPPQTSHARHRTEASSRRRFHSGS